MLFIIAGRLEELVGEKPLYPMPSYIISHNGVEVLADQCGIMPPEQMIKAVFVHTFKRKQ